MNDLIPFIESKYSVKKDRASRALSGFSMGGMQTINIGLCQHLKDFAWFGAFSPAPSSFSSDQVASYLTMENQVNPFPVSYFYAVVGDNDSTAGASFTSATQALTQKTDYLTSANFTAHKVPGGTHNYPTASVGLYNFLRIAFAY
jgi:endo-1,4-beta-xylanase